MSKASMYEGIGVAVAAAIAVFIIQLLTYFGVVTDTTVQGEMNNMTALMLRAGGFAIIVGIITYLAQRFGFDKLFNRE